MVDTYQKHSHSESCRKYRKLPCRLHFGQFFTEKTIIAEPLLEEMDDVVRASELRRSMILDQVKKYIDEYLNPSKHQECNLNRNIQEILNDILITEDDYHKALSISLWIHSSG